MTAAPSSSEQTLPLSTILIFLFFFTNFLFFLLFYFYEKLTKSSATTSASTSSSSSLTTTTQSLSTFSCILSFISSFFPSTTTTTSSPSSTSISSTSSSHSSHKQKKLSTAFDGTISCYISLTSELFLTSCIIILTYIFEHLWIFPHSEKEYSRDLFMFVCILFFLYAIYTIKPINDLSILGRDQTEEWKGWMQFIFLLYHYFHAEEVYNSVRVMITCYVWMTGFGNFSFFYIKQDYSWLRVIQMLWRLNFAVIFLILIQNNTYILYYICPLHTFYFSLVYITMYLFQSVNHMKWGIRFKLLFLGLVIYLVWDVSGKIFDFVFFFLGTESVIGAKLGTLWEWYFRSSLDHWSTFYGMIFALNYPIIEQYFKIANTTSLCITGILLFGLSLWWYQEIYSLDKLSYNLHHSYFAFIPLISYIFFRNITPTIRSGVSMSLHVLGKTTLETYLLQHHVWLTSNAKTLLTIIPNMPWVNFAITSLLFYSLSHELYRLTMSLRGMILPDNKDIAWRNIIGTSLVIIYFTIAASLLYYLEVSWLGIGLGSIVSFFLLTFPMRQYSKGVFENELFLVLWKKFAFFYFILFILGISFHFTNNSPATSMLITSPSSSATSMTTTTPLLYKNPSLIHQCQNSLTSGYWDIQNTCQPSLSSASSSSSSHPATNSPFINEIPTLCQIKQWKWSNNVQICHYHEMKSAELLNIFRNHHVYFLGDSTIRALYHRFNKLLNPKYSESSSLLLGKHENYQQYYADGNISVEFHWNPFITNLTTEFHHHSVQFQQKKVIYITGVSLWDSLHYHNLQQYQQSLNSLSQVLPTSAPSSSGGGSGSGSGPSIYWIGPLHIINQKLNTNEKQQYMTEEIIETYRQAIQHTSSLMNSVHYLDTKNVTKQHDDETIDGIHYSSFIYDIIIQFISNSYYLNHYYEIKKLSSTTSTTTSSGNTPTTTSRAPTSKPTGSMSNPFYGFITLFVAIIMLFTWDNFFGIGWLSLKLVSKSYDWNEAYVPLLKKIMPHLYRETKNPGEEDDDEEKKPMLELSTTKD